MLQQIPGAKIIYVSIGITTECVLCHSPNMGYYIAASVKPEDVVICTPRQALIITNMLQQMPNILLVNAHGNEEQRPMCGAKWMICDVKFIPEIPECNPQGPEPKPEEKQYAYRFVNGDGNYLRFASAHPGYYIDSNGPASHIVMFYDEQAANDFLADMGPRGLILKNLSGEVVNSDLTVFIRPNEMWS